MGGRGRGTLFDVAEGVWGVGSGWGCLDGRETHVGKAQEIPGGPRRQKKFKKKGEIGEGDQDLLDGLFLECTNLTALCCHIQLGRSPTN